MHSIVTFNLSKNEKCIILIETEEKIKLQEINRNISELLIYLIRVHIDTADINDQKPVEFEELIKSALDLQGIKEYSIEIISSNLNYNVADMKNQIDRLSKHRLLS